ncbi:MAG TPA: helix-turn-helix domain-containing protein [Gemmatimonadaceae bacterium]|nr:helix-turn-helix domain-containing protein [Gemmatimonadaceae bacterium]
MATVLHPSERSRVDAAGDGVYHALHRQTFDEVVADLRAHRVGAVIVSVARCGPDECSHLAQLVREFPRVPAIALLSRIEPATPQAVLTLGQCGVRDLVDVREGLGWGDLRTVLANSRSDDIARLALGMLSLDLVGVSDDCWRFFEAIFRPPTGCATVRSLCRELQVLPSTLVSRFFRARLPAPRLYLAYARLMQAARAFENPGLSIANVANGLDYSSPQSFGRHVRTLLGLSALEFRRRYDGEGMLQRFREELVLPFADTLRRFYPLSKGTRWSGILRGEP